MKRAGILVLAGLFVLMSLPAFSQTQSNPKDAYVKTVPLVKVWMNQLGYVATFMNSKSQMSSIYVPLTWFGNGPDAKADIIYGNVTGYPYCSIYWVDGKFDHITLYVLNDYNSQSWGILEGGSDLATKFNVQDVPTDF